MRDPYARAATKVVRAIAKWGRPITLIVVQVTPPMDGSDTGIVAENRYEGIKALILPSFYTRGKGGLAAEGVVEDVLTYSRRVLIAGKTCPVVMQDDMQVEFDNQTWQVEGIKPTGPSGPVIIYDFQATITP